MIFIIFKVYKLIWNSGFEFVVVQSSLEQISDEWSVSSRNLDNAEPRPESGYSSLFIFLKLQTSLIGENTGLR